MALRDQPYLPLYIQDFLTDEKLSECSAASTGVYVRLMCLMHKSEQYGKILLKQKHKQTGKQIEDFASLFAKSMPYDSACIIAALTELLEEKVIKIEGDYLVQKRMVRDNEISLKRSESGSKGGNKTQETNKKFALPKVEANTENENVIVIKEKEPEILKEMTKADLVLFQSKLMQEAMFIEQLMMSKGIKDKMDMLGWIKYFNLHIIGEDKLNKDYSEYKKHFKNWIIKFDTTKPPPINGNTNVVPMVKQSVDEMMEKYK